MSRTSEALAALVKNWEVLKSARPGEGDFSSFGYPMTYESFDELFRRWESILTILDEKGYWSNSPEVAVADGPMAAQLNELSGLVVNAPNNGVHWMLSNRFIETANSLQQQLSGLTRHQATLNKEVARILVERSAESLDDIVSAARSAKKVISLGKESSDNAQRIAEATSAVEAATALAEATNLRFATLAKEADDNTIAVKDDKAVVKKARDEIADLKKIADKREKELEERIQKIDAQLTETETSATNAYKSVEEALRQVRNQGLAKSFQDRSNSLQVERIFWTVAFAASALGLLAIAIIFAVELSTMTYEALLVHLLRKIGLAAPLVWLGWYSARQTGRISRVQEDYEYKAASALAFQSYKDEVKLGGDPEMEKKLLEHAITTFGENPVRLYDTHASEPVTPLQAAIKELPPEKIAAILASLGEQSLKAKFWPFGGGK